MNFERNLLAMDLIRNFQIKEQAHMQNHKKTINIFFTTLCLMVLCSTTQLCADFFAYSAPKTVVDSNGNQIAIFLQQDSSSNFQVMGATWDSTNGWSTPVALSTSTRNAYAHLISIDSSDRIVAYWEALDSTAGTDYVEAITYIPGSGWGTLKTVSNGTDDAAFGDQRLTTDSSGKMTLVWSAFNASGEQSIKSSYATFGANPTWSTEVTVAQGVNTP